MLPVPPLLVISDRRQARQPLQQVGEAGVAAGCRCLSRREKDLPPEERRALLGALVTLGRRYGAVVTAHEDIEAVAAAGAGAGGRSLAAGPRPRPAARAREPGLHHREQARLRPRTRPRWSRTHPRPGPR